MSAKIEDAVKAKCTCDLCLMAEDIISALEDVTDSPEVAHEVLVRAFATLLLKYFVPKGKHKHRDMCLGIGEQIGDVVESRQKAAANDKPSCH